jgi:GDP-4-dehydro-6-deoxy-D-mannose reductase
MNSRNFKKILITGVNGSVGSYLFEFLRKKKLNIYGTFRVKKNLKYLKQNNKKLIKLDLNNFKKTLLVLKKTQPDLIFHLASNADVRKSFDKPREIINNNNNCTLNLLEAIRCLKIDPLIIISSTSEVYGNSKKNTLDESLPIIPNNPYAVSKAFQDLLAQNYSKIYKLKIIITRMFTYLNPRRDNLFASSWANQILAIEQGKKKILEHGNLDSFRSIMSMHDAINAYWLTAKKGKIGEIYNIGDGKNIKLEKFLNILKSFSKRKIVSKVNKKLLRKTDINKQIQN